jgi:hypothetical protein
VNNKRYVLSIILSVVILALVFWKVLSLGDFVGALLMVSIPLFFAADIPYGFQAILMGYRLKWAMNNSGENVTLTDATLAHLLGMFGSDFSVGRSAYLSASLPFNSELAGNVGVVSATIVVDTVTKAVLAVISAIYFIGFFGLSVNPVLILFAIAVIVGGVLFAILIFNPKSISIVAKIPYLGKLVMPYYVQFKTAFDKLKGNILIFAVFPLVGWVLRGAEWYILGLAVGVHLSFFTWFMIHPLLTLVELIPVSVNGIGFFELTLIGLFPELSAAKLVTFGLLDVINNTPVNVFGFLSLKRMKK